MAAPFLGEARATHHRVRLGSVELTMVLDGAPMRQGVHPTFGHDQTEEAFVAYARARRMPARSYEAVFVPALVNTGRELVLFDTGVGAGARTTTGSGQLLPRLAAAGYRPEMVDVVALTHAHPDHIGGLWEDGAPAFPNARYVIGRAEYEGWLSGEGIPPQRAQSREMFLKILPPLAEKTTFIEPGDSVAGGITAVDTHGHSIGHMAYLVESEGKSLLLWGDVANHPVFSVERPEWEVSFDDDRERAIETRKRVLDWVATDGIPILGYHMPFPGIGFIEHAAESYRYVPETYRLKM